MFLPDYKEAEGERGGLLLSEAAQPQGVVGVGSPLYYEGHLMDSTNDYMMALLKDVLSDVRSMDWNLLRSAILPWVLLWRRLPEK